MKQIDVEKLLREGRARIHPDGNVWSVYRPEQFGEYYEEVLRPIAEQKEEEARMYAEVQKIIEDAFKNEDS